jgi:hypothetical protein
VHDVPVAGGAAQCGSHLLGGVELDGLDRLRIGHHVLGHDIVRAGGVVVGAGGGVRRHVRPVGDLDVDVLLGCGRAVRAFCGLDVGGPKAAVLGRHVNSSFALVAGRSGWSGTEQEQHAPPEQVVHQ